MQVTGAVFHQADAAERAPLAKFIQENSGKTIEFETADAQVHSATLFRMKSCFGRGMLVLRSGDAHLAERSTFTLRLPAK